jgi:hypothetical protein
MNKGKETEIRAALRAGLMALDCEAVDDELFEEQRGLFLAAVEGVDANDLGPILEEIQRWREDLLRERLGQEYEVEELAREEIGLLLGGAKLAGIEEH